MNPFQKHQIDHLSASSLNTYAEEPAFWTLIYLHGHRDEAGPAAWRGQAVEAGLDHWLYKRDFPAALQATFNRFEEQALGDLEEAVEAERKNLVPMLEQATMALSSRPEPVGRQLKIEHWFDGIEVPLIGYIDYDFGDEGIDLKTTKRMPSIMPPRHARQLSLYAAARNKPFKALYVTDKKSTIKSVDDHYTHLKRMEWYAHSIRRLLSMFSDKYDASRIFAPNLESFYWGNSKELRKVAAEIWSSKGDMEP